MSLDAIPFNSLSETHLQALVLNQERENKHIEFKVSLPGNGHEDRREFLADFTSFANTVGGDLLYGILAPQGIAEEVVGLDEDLDAETNRLENLIRTGIQPRISSYTVKIVQLKKKKAVLVFRIGRSWALPHRVTLGSHDKFYGRNATGKYPLDVPELRSLFLLSESTADRVRAFRAERISSILSQETPVPLIHGPRTVIHIIPFTALGIGQSFDVSRKYDRNFIPILPIGESSGYNYRHNFDGILTHTVFNDAGLSSSYLQLFRNGIIESVETDLLIEDNGQPMMHGQGWEAVMLRSIDQYFHVQSDLGVEPPVVVMLSLLNVKGAKMYERVFPRRQSVQRDHLIIAEALADSFTPSLKQLLKPAFDSVWNAFGMHLDMLEVRVMTIKESGLRSHEPIYNWTRPSRLSLYLRGGAAPDEGDSQKIGYVCFLCEGHTSWRGSHHNNLSTLLSSIPKILPLDVRLRETTSSISSCLMARSRFLASLQRLDTSIKWFRFPPSARTSPQVIVSKPFKRSLML